MTIALVPAAACPAPLAGGMLALATGGETFVDPWRAWWLAKLWRGYVLPGDDGWRETVDTRALEADYRAWAREHSPYALHRMPLSDALLFCANMRTRDFAGPVVLLRSLRGMRNTWDITVGPVRWPSAAPAPAARRATPRRPLAPAFALPTAA